MVECNCFFSSFQKDKTGKNDCKTVAGKSHLGAIRHKIRTNLNWLAWTNQNQKCPMYRGDLQTPGFDPNDCLEINSYSYSWHNYFNQQNSNCADFNTTKRTTETTASVKMSNFSLGYRMLPKGIDKNRSMKHFALSPSNNIDQLGASHKVNSNWNK